MFPCKTRPVCEPRAGAKQNATPFGAARDRRSSLSSTVHAGGRIEFVDFAEVIGKLKTAASNGELVNTARSVGIQFGEE
jgi:hypothetical protein